MILIALALATQPLWTGPRTEEYKGPGNFCGGGYRIALSHGDRALVLPQDTGGQATRLVIGGREVNIRSGARPGIGQVVLRVAGGAVTQARVNGQITYFATDDTPYAISVTSDAFRGYKQDRWFFSHANFAADSDAYANCLSAFSH